MFRATGAGLFFLLLPLAPARLAAHDAEYVDIHQIAVGSATYGDLFRLVAPDLVAEERSYGGERLISLSHIAWGNSGVGGLGPFFVSRAEALAFGADDRRRALPSAYPESTSLLTPSGGDASRISCIAGNFDIKQGIATTRGTVVETPGATVVGTGNINLRDERIDMRVDPKSKDLNLTAIAVPMRVTGPLASPNVIPDPVATVGNTVNFATGTVNVATLGIFGALTGLGEGESAGDNPCATAVNSALTAKPQPTTGEKVMQGVGGAAQGIGEGAADVLKGVGEGIGNLFGQ